MSKGNREDMLKSTKENEMDGSPTAIKPSKPCVCPKCGALIPSQVEAPCYKRNCPKCETRMLSL